MRVLYSHLVRVLLVREISSLCRIGLSLGTSKYDLEVIFIAYGKSYIISHTFQGIHYDWTWKGRERLRQGRCKEAPQGPEGQHSGIIGSVLVYSEH